MTMQAWWHAIPTKDKAFWGGTVATGLIIATAFAWANGGGPSVAGLIPSADGFATASLVPSFGGEAKPVADAKPREVVALEKADRLPEPKRKVSARLPAEAEKSDIAVSVSTPKANRLATR